MKLSGFDLNLLVVFDAMMAELNTTKAGSRIGMSQPAVSKALTRLRHHLRDELFIRSSNGMRPTPRAYEIYPEVRQSLQKVDAVLNPSGFEPAESAWQFRVVVNDYLAMVFIPGIVETMRREAPNVDLSLLPSVGRGFEALDNYEADFILSPLFSVPERFTAIKLLDEDYVMLTRADHPLATGKLTLQKFADAQHVLVTLRGDAHGFVDDILEESGLSRRIAVTTNSYSAGPRIVARSDLIMTVPRHLAEDFGRSFDLSFRSLPFDVKNDEKSAIMLTWHKGLATHPAHDWFRGLIKSALSQ